MLECIYNDHYYYHQTSLQFDKYCSVLACVNKELSADVPYQFIRLTWKRNFDSPLHLVIERRLYSPQRKDQCLMIAEKLLQNKFDPNRQLNYTGRTPLQIAAQHRYEEIVELFLKYGGDPFKVTVHWILQGPLLYLNAFQYANNDFTESVQFNSQPSGWFKDLWDKVQDEKEKQSQFKRLSEK